MLQELWKSNLHWDEELSSSIATKWVTFLEALPRICKIRIPRWLGTEPAGVIQIHGFADASQSAYAAVVYAVIPATSRRVGMSRLLAAKTKVAPLKTITIPRLELCAAALLAKLLRHMIDKFVEVSPTAVHAWTASEIALAWLKSDPSRWKVFVANRVVEIKRTLPNVAWHHFHSDQNPADIASRGMLPAEVKESSLWWNGPTWMYSSGLWGPRPPTSIPSKDLLEINPPGIGRTCLSFVVQHPLEDPSARFSSLLRLERVIAYCLRLRHRSIASRTSPIHGGLTSDELETAFLRSVYWVQRTYFAEEIRSLEAQSTTGKNSPRRKLTPFLDECGILRVGGRLKESGLPYSERHPVMLPKQCNLSILVIEWAH